VQRTSLCEILLSSVFEKQFTVSQNAVMFLSS